MVLAPVDWFGKPVAMIAALDDTTIVKLAFYMGLVLAVGFGGLTVSTLLGRKKSNLIKSEPYECGVPQLGATRTEFNTRFFIIAMLFILFDIETVLLAPYAVTFKADAALHGWEYLSEVAVFVAVLGFGLMYAWRKGVLDWNVPLGVSPQEVARRLEDEEERRTDDDDHHGKAA